MTGKRIRIKPFIWYSAGFFTLLQLGRIFDEFAHDVTVDALYVFSIACLGAGELMPRESRGTLYVTVQDGQPKMWLGSAEDREKRDHAEDDG